MQGDNHEIIFKDTRVHENFSLCYGHSDLAYLEKNRMNSVLSILGSEIRNTSKISAIKAGNPDKLDINVYGHQGVFSNEFGTSWLVN